MPRSEPTVAAGQDRSASPLTIRIDLHVHTRRYSPCAPTLASEAVVAAINTGRLEGAVITDHDRLWPATDIKALNTELSRGRIFGGIEVSGRNGHFVLIGLVDPIPRRACDSFHALCAATHAQGGVVIWAHPYQHYSQMIRPFADDRLPAGIDAIEVASTVTQAADSVRARQCAHRYGLSMVGGSDAHSPAALGRVWTRFARLPADERDLAELIREGRCAPEVAKPVTHASA